MKNTASNNPSRQTLARTTAQAGLLLALSNALNAFAFSEDVCPSAQGGWTSCIQQACMPGGENLFCESATMLSQYVTLFGGESTGFRSVIHFDSLYLLAQAAGLPPKDAFQVASYDQAVDTGAYDHRDEFGQIMVDRAGCGDPAQASEACTLNSADISGVGRNNFTGGGLFFHFHTVPEKTRATSGLAPHVEDGDAEPFLNHLRQWAHGKGPLCLGGLQGEHADNGLDSGAICYQSKVRSSTQLLGRIPFVSEFGDNLELDWISDIAEQKVVRNSQTGEYSFASELEKNLPKGVPADMVRMGIYLHAMQDRISHHRCVLSSNVEGPRPADANAILTNAAVKSLYDLGIFRDPASMLQNAAQYPVMVNPEFFFEFNRQECDQLSHFQRHSFEVGVDQDTLDAQDRTTEAGLKKAFAELAYFAQTIKGYKAGLDADQIAPFMADLVQAIEEPDAAARIRKISEVAPAYQLLPLPGHHGVSMDQWLQQAQTLSEQAASGQGSSSTLSPSEATPAGTTATNNATTEDAGGGALQLPLLALMLIGFALRRQQV